MTDVGELVVRIKADATQMQSELRNATGTVKQSASAMTSALGEVKAAATALLPAISAVALISFAKNAFEAADHLNDLGLRIGFAGSTLSALNVPLKQSGSNVDDFAASVNLMNANIGQAVSGNQQAIKNFDALGLSVTKLKQLSPEQQFYAIASAIAQVKSQSEQTDLGRGIFGRGFAAILPLIKESNGRLLEFVETQKKMGNALTDDQLKRIDDLGDRWVAAIEKLKLELLEVVPLIEHLAAIPDYLRAAFIEIPQQAGSLIGQKISGNNPRVSTTRPTTVNEATFLNGRSAKNDNQASGSNAGLIKPPEHGAAALAAYIRDLHEETAALSMGKEALAEYKAEKGAATAAGVELNRLSPATKAAVDAEADAYYEATEKAKLLNEEQQKHIQMVAQMEGQISSSLADMVVNWKSAGASIKGVLDQIAKQIIEMQITTPLVEAIGGTKGSPGIFGSFLKSLPHFAAGGNISGPSVVGEKGPELFIPHSSGTIVPNHKMGGGVQIIVQQTINLSPGLLETINVAIQNASPQIAAAAHASLVQAVQRGGPESKVFNKRT